MGKSLERLERPKGFHIIDRQFGANIDPLGVLVPLLHAQMSWLFHPLELSDSVSSLTDKLAQFQFHCWCRAIGITTPDVERPHPDDARFSDSVWTDSAFWDLTKEWYLLSTHSIQDMLHTTPGLSGRERRKAAFWWREWLNAVAPTNFLLTNPVAIRKAIESNGETLFNGFRIFMADLQAGTVRMSSPDSFVVGGNLATSKGKVVFRNQLLEVIHYVPTVDRVHKIPIVLVTPWINKYYVLDLTPKKSLVKYLLDQGFDVFITSWKNPDEQMSEVSFDDYLTKGVDKIVEVARSISGAAQVNAVGYCIGGAALATYMAWANRRYPRGQVPVGSATFFATLTDYRRPGDIEVFLDEGSVAWLSRTMDRKGYLDGEQMASAFRILRSNSLIWHYVVHGYLYGESPPAFDVLYWNMDTTRMPARMHQWYLQEFYLHNNLIKKDVLAVAGQKIDLGTITQPVYAVGAADDHIAPWKQVFRVNGFVAGPKRFVLSSSGHILGIVNPPASPPKREYWVSDVERHETAETWQERAKIHKGTWWEDWIAWLRPQSGEVRDASEIGAGEPQHLGDAPGAYVLER